MKEGDYNTEEVRIETRDIEGTLGRATARFMARPEVSQANKDLVAKFLREAALGKTVVGRARKQIGPDRRHLYLMQLTIFIDYLGKDLEKVVMEDMERFVEALDGGKICSRRPTLAGRERVVHGSPLSPRYRTDIKITLRKFYKWLWGGNRRTPELVDWFDTSYEVKDVAALSEDDVRRMLDHCKSVEQRAIIQVLFDSGLRIGELVNVRLRHIWRRTVVPTDPSTTCYFLRVPFSKTLSFYSSTS